jgi:hypothetical protein
MELLPHEACSVPWPRTLQDVYGGLTEGLDCTLDLVQHLHLCRSPVTETLCALPCSGTAFSDAADAALGTKLSPRFTPYLDQPQDLIFLHGAFIFEDVGVTAYKVCAWPSR